MRGRISGYERVVNPLVALAVGLTLTACRGERPTTVPQPTPVSTPTPPFKTPSPLPHAPTIAIPTQTPSPTPFPESLKTTAWVSVSSELAGQCVPSESGLLYATTLDMRAEVQGSDTMTVRATTYAQVHAVLPTGEVVLELTADGAIPEVFIVPPGATVFGYEPIVAVIDGIGYSTSFKYGLFTYTGPDADGNACFIAAPNEPAENGESPFDVPPETSPQLPASTYQL